MKIAFYWIFLFILSLSFSYGEEIEIRILHVNDFHGYAEPYKPLGSDEMLGGIIYLSAKVEELRKERPSLLLSSGDMIQGNNWANLFQGESVMELMNRMRFDVMALGNHEFDFGQDILKKRISEANFPVIGANVEGLEGIKPYTIKELNGVKLAIIGVVTEDTPITAHPKNIEGLRFFSPIDTVEKFIKELKNQADLIVILSHLGYPMDRILAEKVKEIDVIVGGHSHTKISKPVKVENTIIAQVWEYGEALGVLDLTLKNGKIQNFGGHFEEIRPTTGEEDQSIVAIVEKYKQRVDAVLNGTVGEAEVDLDGENVRKRETNLGNLIADIMRSVSKADVTILNGGAIRTNIKKGEVKVKDIYSVLPFDIYIISIKLTGKQIREALEHGVSTVKEEEGRFPQVSGLTFKYAQWLERGSRIKEIFIAGKPIFPDKEYIVATNDFLAAGGDGYKVFGEAIKTSQDFSVIGGLMKSEKVVYNDSGRWLRDAVVEYLKGMKKITSNVEGRIIEIYQ